MRFKDVLVVLSINVSFFGGLLIDAYAKKPFFGLGFAVVGVIVSVSIWYMEGYR